MLIDKNSEGYSDKTASTAVRKADTEQEKFEEFLSIVFILAKRYGYSFGERLVVKDKRTGRVWR